MPDAKGKIFFVGRFDGLGARLSSMLDAIWLADRFGGRFRFHWFNTAQSPQEPVIRPRTEVFSAAFLQAHHVDIAQFRSWTPRPLSGLPMPFEDALRPDSGIDCFSITWAPLRLQGPGLSALAAEGRDRRAAFDAIGFSPALERARRLAATVALPPGAAALHLRAGDVVHGPYRAGGGHHGRVISYPIALHILRQQAEAGVPMILFGQDAALCEHAKRAHGAVLAADLTAGLGFTGLQQALFEIVLMARCGEIHAGNSAFAVTAAKIAGVRISDPARAIPPRHAANIIARTLRAPANAYQPVPLERAMAAWHAVMALRHDATNPTCRAMIREAIRHDPANPFYRAIEAVAQYATGAPEDAEGTLLAALTGEEVCPDLVRHLAGLLPRTPGLNDPQTLAMLGAAARAGRPAAALLLALHARAARDEDGYAANRALYLAHRSDGMPRAPEVILGGAAA